ncbi:RiPP maturation radical SAM C-methyltransferase [Dictyobacter formicarum]|uniref:RiPP maturation radical SAM protein 1 n=1 Tax=Dictyobacter formicarum TaxID=2778368 RepID=A0ABQ3V9K4_9CHLR|nr:RiPP maturation radical SAM C-methyltransferase [Dictyobacter formicarum]GHO82600.1 RiPP maturation radical SAM protein 1 [Dictyobacter formicarum]
MQAEISNFQSSNPITRFRVALVCMPFLTFQRPSIQIGLLTSIAEQAGFSTDAHHLNLDLAARITPEVYEGLCDHRGRMTSEWLFSIAAFGQDVSADDAAYFRAFPQETEWLKEIGKDTGYLSTLRHEILPRYIEDCLASVDWGRYLVVGFSSTHQQHVACLALARRIKECYPEVQIVFGGANLEDEMGPEYVRAFPFIDYAVVGEGDIVFPALLRCLAAHEQPKNLPGLVRRVNGGVQFYGQATPVRNMDALPVPNYDEYFERTRRLGLKPYGILPFETSRGCWWGQKHHCTFCGLNGLGITYRAKSPRHVLTELSELTRKHRISLFGATDNILDMKYVKNFFTVISEAKTDYQFFYEVKANLSREQIQTLYRGGLRWIQPGIESMSSRVLQLMRKGSTMLQNVRLLKWCCYYKIRVSWNLIWGFPGETKEDYRQELEVLKLLPHLQPPGGASRIWLERFSPYFTEQGAFPIHDVRPEASYSYVYPAYVELDKIAYFFDYQMENTTKDDVHSETCEWVREWRRRWEAGSSYTLTYRRTDDALFIDDNRGIDKMIPFVFEGPLALIYEYCSETMRTVPQVVEYLGSLPDGQQFPQNEIRGALDVFCQAGLMLSEEGKYFSLAIPANPNW